MELKSELKIRIQSQLKVGVVSHAPSILTGFEITFALFYLILED